MSWRSVGYRLAAPLRRGALLWAGTATFLVSAAASGQSAPADWVVPERRARRANPVAASQESVAGGSEVYRRECLSCHGKSGRGDGSKASELKTKVADLTSPRVREQSDGALFWKITEGRGDMPSNRTALTDEERWNVVNYIRSLTPKG